LSKTTENEVKSHEEETIKTKNRNRKQAGTKAAGQKSGHQESVELEKSKEIDISPYVSNVEGNIYAITGLPEEFIATLFAWVSRSPKSFKEHLKQALQEEEFGIEGSERKFPQLDEKAKKFHEKWTVGYGHSSVAEHAVAHVGVEKVSRLASSELELCNTFLSITEYSQRYQKPKRGDWHNPFINLKGKKEAVLSDKFEEFLNKAFDYFELLIEGVYTHLKKQFVFSDEYKELEEKGDTKAIDRKLSALEKLAFEDARYVLPLAMYTQLGMTANGRAWRDGLAKLGVSDYPEVRQMADDIRTEITKVLPVLLKYATPSDYQKYAAKKAKSIFKPAFSIEERQPKVRILNIDSEYKALNDIYAIWRVKHCNESYVIASQVALETPLDEKIEVVRELLHEMKHFDTPPEEFHHVKYMVEFLVSEANWHQLLRHNRKTYFTWNRPTPYFGITIPPRIKEAGLSHLVEEIAALSKDLYEIILASDHPELADYVVINAHHRRVVASFDLWEVYHLINLRTSEEAQWDIRQAFEQLYKQLLQLHPNLIYQAQRRV
jgi:thymidylate synthase ThyX